MNPPAFTPEWQPGLSNDDSSLGDVLRTMPGDPPSAVPWYVRMLENPNSPMALAGAVDLFAHDCIHVLLGRGTDQQDEAFVIGFTMGASKKLSTWQQVLYRWCASSLYGGPYRFSVEDQAVFDLAVSVGRWCGCRPLHRVDYRPLLPAPLGQVRRQVGLEVDLLIQAYECEYRLWPNRPASQRLPRARQGPAASSPGRVLAEVETDDGYQQQKQKEGTGKRQPLVEQHDA
jgi:hypothetical protein